MNNILLLILEIYVGDYLSVVLHELFHFIAFYILSGRVNRVVIGSKHFAISLGPFIFSPILLTGYNEVSVEDLERISCNGKALFYLSGIMANVFIIAIAGIFLLVVSKSFLCVFLLTMNAVIVIINLLPIEGTDFYEIISLHRDHSA